MNCNVVIETSAGTMKAELWADKAPKTVDNFLKYADSGYYEGLVFHRIIRGFMIQGGGFDLRLEKKATSDPIKNEARSDVLNKRGTLSMARTPAVDSATSQFFINHGDNTDLDHKDDTDAGYGYCVFGKLTDGYEVLEAIAGVKTGNMGQFQNVPERPIVIKSIRRIEE
jgi:cyclophilin family peptidyl-prolyl cis-trans isomerase